MLIYQNQQDNFHKRIDKTRRKTSQRRKSNRSTSRKPRALTKKNILFLKKLGLDVKERKHVRQYSKN